MVVQCSCSFNFCDIINSSLTIIWRPLFIYGLVFCCVIYILNQFFQWESLSIHLSENITCPFSKENLFGYECRKTDTHFQYLKYLIFWLIFVWLCRWVYYQIICYFSAGKTLSFSFSNIQFQCLLGFSYINAFVFSVPLGWSLKVLSS